MMKRILPILSLAAALVIAGCEQSAPPTPQPTIDTKADRALIARIEALPPGQLNGVLFRAIRDAGHPCQGIAIGRRIDDQRGRPAWSAQCNAGGGRFLLVLSPAGLMNVTPGEAFVRR